MSCFNWNSNSSWNMGNVSNVERRILIGSLRASVFCNINRWDAPFLFKPFHKRKQFVIVCILTSYVGDNFSTTLTTVIWIEAQSTWSTHRPRCTCKFFRLLIKDGYTYMCRTLQCLYMKLNGGSRVLRWRTHRYLWVIRNTTEIDINYVLLCHKKCFMFWSTEESRWYWY